MARKGKGRPSPGRRIAELEETVFSQEKALVSRGREVEELRAALAEARKRVLAANWRFHRLQRIVFARHPVEETRTDHGYGGDTAL